MKATRERVGFSAAKSMNCYGANISLVTGAAQLNGDCPFCGREKKFWVSADSGLWDCKVCGESGNLMTFLSKVLEYTKDDANEQHWEDLEKHRGIPRKIFKLLGWQFCATIDRWLIPGRSPSGAVHDIRRYSLDAKIMASTSGCKAQLWLAEHLSRAKRGSRVWLCEGESDAVAMTWILDAAGTTGDVVVAVPGAATFKPEWVELFRGMHVVACYDADDAGRAGALKCHQLLVKVAKSIKHVRWAMSVPNGYDVRDYAIETMAAGGGSFALSGLKSLLAPLPPSSDHEEAVEVSPGTAVPIDVDDLPPAALPEVLEVFSRRIKMTPDLRMAVVLSLAVCVSQEIPGDPVWLYLVGPPGAGKTMILSALSDSQRCIFRSSLTPHCLVSGWKQGANSADPSLIPKVAGMTLVLKDFTEILSMPEVHQEEIFSTLRGAYDGFVQKTFGNGVTREYANCWFSMLAGVTHAVNGSNHASLGERFLKFSIGRLSGQSAEDVISAAIASVGIAAEAEDAMRQVAARFLNRRIDTDSLPSFGQDFAFRLTSLVQLVAVLRVQVSRDKRATDIVAYRPMPENGTRLAKQLVKLGMALCLVLDRREVDQEIYGILERVAYDTVSGFSLDIVAAIMLEGGESTRSKLSEAVGTTFSTITRRLEDLELAGVLIRRQDTLQGPGRPSVVWTVTPPIQKLWNGSKGFSCQAQDPNTTSTPPSRRLRVFRKRSAP